MYVNFKYTKYIHEQVLSADAPLLHRDPNSYFESFLPADPQIPPCEKASNRCPAHVMDPSFLLENLIP